MEFLPLFHNLRGSRVLVVGGGEIALRKSRLLADAGALLRVVAPEVEPQLRELVTASGGECLLRGYLEADLDGCGLIIAATDDEPLNAQVSTDAHRRCVPVNVVDAPALCSVIFPAIVDRSPLVIAVSSGGDAPVLARLIRAKLETWIPSTYGQLAGLAARFRNQVKGLFPDVQQRRAFWEDVFQGPIADRQLAGQGDEVCINKGLLHLARARCVSLVKGHGQGCEKKLLTLAPSWPGLGVQQSHWLVWCLAKPFNGGQAILRLQRRCQGVCLAGDGGARPLPIGDACWRALHLRGGACWGGVCVCGREREIKGGGATLAIGWWVHGRAGQVVQRSPQLAVSELGASARPGEVARTQRLCPGPPRVAPPAPTSCCCVWGGAGGGAAAGLCRVMCLKQAAGRGEGICHRP